MLRAKFGAFISRLKAFYTKVTPIMVGLAPAEFFIELQIAKNRRKRLHFDATVLIINIIDLKVQGGIGGLCTCDIGCNCVN